jgi:hypothetical protein
MRLSKQVSDTAYRVDYDLGVMLVELLADTMNVDFDSMSSCCILLRPKTCVECEPVSDAKFPASREFSRENFRKDDAERNFAIETCVISIA